MSDPAIRVEAGGKWLAFPCQGGDRTCRIPLSPQRGAQGDSAKVESQLWGED